MFTNNVLRMSAVLLALGVPARASAAGPATLDAPASVPAGSAIKVAWAGPGGQWDRIGIAPANAPDRPSPDAPQSTYATGNAVTIVVPDEPGAYEGRYFSSDPRTVLARRKVTVLRVTASLDGPARAIAGSAVNVKWTGPNNGSDRIHVVKAGAPEQTRSDLSVPVGANPARVTVPDVPGEYELRYLTAQSHITLPRAPVPVAGPPASIAGPGPAPAGSYFSVSWTGPGNDYDYITVSPKGSTEDRWANSSA